MTTDEQDHIRLSFLSQAKACTILGSPFTARICRLLGQQLNTGTTVGQRVLSWTGNVDPGGDALALRCAGALHALVLSGMSSDLAAVYPPHLPDDETLWRAISSALSVHEAFVLDRLTSAPQTNEVRRSAALLPGFLTIAKQTGKPLVLSEIGASAGLNLQWDRYHYNLGGFRWGEASSVELTPEWTGPPPPDAHLIIASRAACDLNPLDSSSEPDRLRMLSYIWADQTERLERTGRALDIAAQNRLSVDRADAVEWLKFRLDQEFPRMTHVIYHSVAWQYLPAEARAAGDRLIEQAGLRATDDMPLARLQMEADSNRGTAALKLQIWPGGACHEIGRADFHGRSVEWKGWAGV